MKPGKIFLLGLLFLMAGCGGPPEHTEAKTTGRYQTVTVNTPGVEGATCVVQNGAGSWTVPAPGPVTVRRTPWTMTINCFKGEHLRGAAQAAPSFAPAEAGTGENCVTCHYPGIVNVALVLNDSLMAVPILRQGP
jgi:hypothetical protein